MVIIGVIHITTIAVIQMMKQIEKHTLTGRDDRLQVYERAATGNTTARGG